ncbi:hypothetical protein NA57DRAFT_56386 [Rhizodiscina lignyota]|uniref:DUF1330 domain-containing protein n=1 Tax=Rhizodiscina lignyota TaxID=1504668 RepID=A0A9P4M6C3_9PEZI|nr:hypothetical protein NA57DRAFT_56386 [Rhizodiscina lignyota]
MPVSTLHLLSLNTSLANFLSALRQSSVKPLTVGRVVRWVILPSSISTAPLLAHNTHWDVLVIVANADPLPADLQKYVAKSWTVKAGIPSRIVKDFDKKNERLLNPRSGDVPPLTGSLNNLETKDSSQSLEVSGELMEWIKEFSKAEGRGAVSMLNLLAFKPDLKSEYLKYGAAFAESIGKRRGGDAKLVGSVLDVSSSPKGVKEWDEIALAHYPSIIHFADMLASEDYQAVNHKHRLGSLRDTFILCTTELDLPWDGKESAKL